MATSLKGKRKKSKNPCPNPLFVQWLTEWRDDAVDRGLNSRFSYGKALASMKKYPIPFSSGKECKILENVGDKMCKMLDMKLAEHISVYGSMAPVDMIDELSYCTSSPPRSKAKPVHSTSVNTACMSKSPTSSSFVHSLSDTDGEASPTPLKKRRNSHSSGEGGKKEYVPAYRSGPYAILLTLYQNFQGSNGHGFMTKADLMTDAQVLSEKSFTYADAGCRYTAWSSMGTLIRKGLVIKESSPAKYTITEAGCEMAHKLQRVNVTGLSPGQSLNKSINSGRSTSPSPLPTLTSSPPFISTAQRTHTYTVTSRSPYEYAGTSLSHSREKTDSGGTTPHTTYAIYSGLRYWYVTDDGQQTIDKNKASVLVSDSVGIGFLIKCNYQDLLKSGKKYKLDMTRPLSDKFVFAHLQDTDAEDFAHVPLEDEKPPVKPDLRTTTVLDNKRSTSLPTTSNPHKPPAVKNPAKEKTKPSSTVTSSSSEHADMKTMSKMSHSVTPSSSASLSERLRTSSRLTNSLHPPMATVISSATSSQNSTFSSQQSQTLRDTVPKFTFKPRTFDIVLCVDNQEYYGKTSSGGKTLFADLIKNGINCDLRKLQVGDFLWVAREKAPNIPGQLSRLEARELVLDHIIERKRMDDLVSSCIDGRFREQKFRLKQCGLRCAIYLIEDYGSAQNFSMPEDRLKQTMANTQVVDGFQVKRTRDNKESVAYLTLMTRYLNSYYRTKTLHAYPADVLSDFSLAFDLHDQEQCLQVFDDFNQASVKTKNLSIREMFGKQIIQMYRLSSEGARAILDHYPTPSHLFEAYDACSSDKERENMLSKIKSGKAGRNLGAAVSRQFYQLYYNKLLT